jgi:hypothetical protein
MTSNKLSRNAPCPCGSGRKYKHCCWGKGFDWVSDGHDQATRAVPLSAEVRTQLGAWRQQFRQRFGREPAPDDLLFVDGPPLEQMEHHIAEALKRARVDPAFIYAFEETGLLVSEDNQHLIPEDDLRTWQAAVARYRARQSSSAPPPHRRRRNEP